MPERKISLFPSVVVGLGGTGRRVCGYLKKTMLDRFGAIPPHVRLIAIDTKKAEDVDDGLAPLDETEKLTLRVENPAQYLQNIEVWAPWFPTGDVGQSLKGHVLVANDAGAGALRPIGRVMIEANWKHVHTRLQRAAEQVNRNLREFDTNGTIRAEFQRIGLGNFERNTQDILFLIIGNLVSGTGSGGFLELAYIAAAARPEGAKVLGFLTLPPHADRREHLHNAAAALRELQHYMSPHIYQVTPKRYRVDSPAARDVLANRHDLTAKAPYDVVHVARPIDATVDAVNALSRQTADFIFDFTCTDLGAALHGEYVNFNPTVNVLGEKPIFSTYASFHEEDHSRTASRLARAMVADFIADNIAGDSNPGEEGAHRWPADVIPSSMEKLRSAWSLPSADLVTAFTTEEEFRKSCQTLLSRIKNEVSRKQFMIGSTPVTGLNAETIRDAIFKDQFLTANLNQTSILLRTLPTRLPPQLEGLSRAYEEALPELMRTLLRELCARMHSIYLSGGSLRQMIEICRALRSEVESLATKISSFEHAVNQEFSFDALLRVLQDYVTRRVTDWTTGGLATFREMTRQQVSIYIEKRTAFTAIRLINGFQTATARPMTEVIHGIEFQLGGGLRAGIERMIGALERLLSHVQAVDELLEGKGSLRTTRDAAIHETLQRIYYSSREAVLTQSDAVRRRILREIGERDFFFSMLDVPQQELEAALDRTAGEYVPDVATEDFASWWAARNINFTEEMLLSRSSLQFDRVRADNEGSGLKTIIALRSRASEDEAPRVTLKELCQVLIPIANDVDNSVAVMVSHGLASVSWIQGFDVLTNGYRQLDESQISMLHTVSDPIRLRPVAIGTPEALMFYITGCAFGWIRPIPSGAIYIYGDDDATALQVTASEYTYARVGDVDSLVGPVAGLVSRLPGLNANPPGPEPPLRMWREGTGMIAASIYEHLRWRLELRVLGTGGNGAQRKKRISQAFKLIRAFLASQLNSGDETHHLSAARIRAAGEQLPSWVRSIFGNFTATDEQIAVAELRREVGADDASAMVLRLRSALLENIDPDGAAAPKRNDGGAVVLDSASILQRLTTEAKLPIRDVAQIIDGYNQGGFLGAIEAAQRCNLTEAQQAQVLATIAGSR